MGKAKRGIVPILAWAWLAGAPVMAVNVPGKVEPTPGNLGSGLKTILARPAAIAGQGEVWAAAIAPENFHALAAVAQSVNRPAARNNAAQGLLSSDANPAAALEDSRKNFDGAARHVAVPGDADSASVPAGFSAGTRAGVQPAVANHSGPDREILSLGEKIARGITRNESLKLVPWEPLWEDDRPTWRLVKEGANLRVQYVPEDLQHANKDVAMAHLMQEVFRAVYSRPDLIEPDLQSNGLFQTLYDTMETGRVVKKGIKERPGLAGNFDAFNREQYGEEGEAAAQRMQGLPSYLRG